MKNADRALQIVEELAKVDTVDTDQIALIRLVVEAQQFVQSAALTGADGAPDVRTDEKVAELQRAQSLMNDGIQAAITVLRGSVELRNAVEALLEDTPYAKPKGDDIEGLYGRLRDALAREGAMTEPPPIYYESFIERAKYDALVAALRALQAEWAKGRCAFGRGICPCCAKDADELATLLAQHGAEREP